MLVTYIYVSFAALAHQDMSKLASLRGGDVLVRYCIQRLVGHLPSMKLPRLSIKDSREYQAIAAHVFGQRFRLRPEQIRSWNAFAYMLLLLAPGSQMT